MVRKSNLESQTKILFDDLFHSFQDNYQIINLDIISLQTKLDGQNGKESLLETRSNSLAQTVTVADILHLWLEKIKRTEITPEMRKEMASNIRVLMLVVAILAWKFYATTADIGSDDKQFPDLAVIVSLNSPLMVCLLIGPRY